MTGLEARVSRSSARDSGSLQHPHFQCLMHAERIASQCFDDTGARDHFYSGASAATASATSTTGEHSTSAATPRPTQRPTQTQTIVHDTRSSHPRRHPWAQTVICCVVQLGFTAWLRPRRAFTVHSHITTSEIGVVATPFATSRDAAWV